MAKVIGIQQLNCAFALLKEILRESVNTTEDDKEKSLEYIEHYLRSFTSRKLVVSLNTGILASWKVDEGLEAVSNRNFERSKNV